MTKSRQSKETPKFWNDENKDVQIEWRRTGTQDEEDAPKERSFGITSSKFHKHTYERENTSAIQPRDKHNMSPHKRKGHAAVELKMQEFHSSVEDRLLHEEKREHLSQLATRRAVFRNLTQLKRWPLQDMAMQHLEQLCSSEPSCEPTTQPTMTPDVSQNRSQNISYSSSSSANSNSTGSSQGNSSVEAKRLMRQQETSPAKSRIKEAIRNEFLTTQQEVPYQDQEPLWSMEPRIFATEKANGKRKYIVGHLGRILDLYWRKICPNQRHFYEVVRENTPCRLYFDMEYSKIVNPEITDEVSANMLDEFRQELSDELNSLLDEWSENDTATKPDTLQLIAQDIVDLDSSNESKFSRHWIVHLPNNYLFPDAVTAGRFVKRLIGRLAEEIGTGQLHSRRSTLAKHLFVNTKDTGKQTCFIDLGVYTRNRLFRVIGSSKFGKPTTLEVAKSNCFPLDLPSKGNLKIKSIKNVQHEDSEGKCGSEFVNDGDGGNTLPPTSQLTMEEFVAANDWKQHARMVVDTLVIPMGCMMNNGNDDMFKILRVPGLDSNNTSPPIHQYLVRYPTRHAPSIGSQSARSTHTSFRESTTPLPALDDFVLNVLATRGGVRGAIRAWSKQEGSSSQLHDGEANRQERGCITFQMVRNRWCELIGRSHKSNNIYWTVDLQTWTCVQGCHDPECHGRGKPVQIPKDVVEKLEQQYHQWQEEEFEKALLALNLGDAVESNENNCSKEIKDNDNEAKKDLAGNSNGAANDVDVEKTSTAKPDTAESGKETNEKKFEDVDPTKLLSDDALLDAILENPELFP